MSEQKYKAVLALSTMIVGVGALGGLTLGVVGLLLGLLRRLISVCAAASMVVVMALAGGSVASASAAGSADLSVGVSGPATAATSQLITYNLSVFDNGPDQSTGVMLSNSLSSAVSYYPSASSGPCSRDIVRRDLVCGSANLPPGMAPDWYITVSTDVAGTLVDTLTGTENKSDPNPANNSASWSTSVTQASPADLSVSKSVSPGHPYLVGDTINYFLFFGNDRPADATNVTMIDQPHPQVRFVSAEAPCSASGNLVKCNLGIVRARSAGDGIQVTVLAVASGTAVNTVNITGDQQDPNTPTIRTR